MAVLRGGCQAIVRARLAMRLDLAQEPLKAFRFLSRQFLSRHPGGFVAVNFAQTLASSRTSCRLSPRRNPRAQRVFLAAMRTRWRSGGSAVRQSLARFEKLLVAPGEHLCRALVEWRRTPRHAEPSSDTDSLRAIKRGSRWLLYRGGHVNRLEAR